MKFPSKLFLLFGIFLVLTLSLVSAISQVNVGEDRGIQITTNQLENLQYNQEHFFEFRTFNKTDGTAIGNTTTNCSFEYFNKNGEELAQKENISFLGDNHWRISLNRNNFTELGRSSLLVECATNGIGGFISKSYIVTANGNAYNPFPIQFSIIILSIILIALGFFDGRARLFKYLGSIMLMIMGILTIYPGYNFINHSTLIGKSLGSILTVLGFYFLIEDSFSKENQAGIYNQYHEDKEYNELNEDLFEE